MHTHAHRYAFGIAAALLACLIPAQSNAMTITEMAWMGSNNSSSCEWIELYNDDDSSVDLTGWMLVLGGTSRSIESDTASLIVPSRGYFVIARSGATCAEYHATIADHTMSMTLTDTGFSYALVDLTNATTSSFAKESIAWSGLKEQNSSRDTLQWTGSTWILSAPTPGEPTPIPYSAATLASDTPSTGAWQPRSASYRDRMRTLAIHAPDVAFRGMPITFSSVTAPRDARKYKRHTWNFGDMTTSSLSEPVHTYTTAGTYLIHLDVADGDDTLTYEREITVIEPPITLTREGSGNIIITNTGEHRIDLGGFTVGAFTIPPNSILLPKRSLTLAAANVQNDAAVALTAPNHTIIATTPESSPYSATARATTPNTIGRQASMAAVTATTDPAPTSSYSANATPTALESNSETHPTPTSDTGIHTNLFALATLITLAAGATFARSRAQ